MIHVLKVLVAIVLILVAGFCIYGFRAGFEPSADPSYLMRILYALVGAASLFAGGYLMLGRKGRG
ncbi:MAG TPA: hypothetical protein VK395_04520 [Gemmataceae bacterium]|nr:hypothetical protein [Gemmataceae bacterium]